MTNSPSENRNSSFFFEDSKTPPLFSRLNETLRSFCYEPGYSDSDFSLVAPFVVQSTPFLSVVMRTQGLRPGTMEQALTCLQAQENQDFEIVVCVHTDSANSEGVQNVQHLLDLFPESLTDKTMLIAVTGGRRGIPMNIGIDHSRGNYVAFLDDDDLVTGEWVSCFAESAAKVPGAIARNRCVDRTVEKRNADSFTPLLTKSNWTVSRPDDFHFLESLERNSTPLHSYAVPRDVITRFGTYVNSDLDVAEDWEYLMRNAALCGVTNNSATTAIYNRWENTESSSHLFEDQHWRDSHDVALAKLTSVPIVIDAKEAQQLVGVFASMHGLSGVIEMVSEQNGFGTIREKLNKLHRLETYATMKPPEEQPSSSHKSKFPKPILAMLVKVKSIIRSNKGSK